MKAFLVEAVSAFRKYPAGAFLLSLSAVMAFIGPFGTFDAMSLPVRFAYWTPIILMSRSFADLSGRAAVRIVPDASTLRWQLVSICIFTLMFSPFVWVISGLFSAGFWSLESLVFISANVFGVTFAVGMLVFLVTHEAPEKEPAGRKARLYERLPRAVGASIVRLSVDDHYVQVHLDDGTIHRVLMRFADAVREMDDTPGFLTHRSHWVAAAYAQQLTRENNRDYLMLESGAKVPISKTYRENLSSVGLE